MLPVIGGLTFYSVIGFILGYTLSTIITSIVAGVLLLVMLLVNILPDILPEKFSSLSSKTEDSYTWAMKIEEALTEPGGVNCKVIDALLKKADDRRLEVLAGILYDTYLRSPGEFLAHITVLTECSPVRSLEVHKKIAKLLVVEGDNGVPYSYVRLLARAYPNQLLPLELIDFIVDTTIIACMSYGRVSSNCIDLAKIALTQFALLCSKDPERARQGLVDLLKNIRGQIIVRKTGDKRQVGLSIAGVTIGFDKAWENILPCVSRANEEKITM